MELASIYFDSIPVSLNNTFSIDFTNKDTTQNIFFNKKLQYFLTNLDCQLDFSDKVKTLNGYSQTKFEKLRDELSDLIRKYNIARKNYQENIEEIALRSTITDEKKYFKLDLNDLNIKVVSLEIEYFDMTDDETKSTYIYDPYKHLVIGMRFKEKSPKNTIYPMIYTVQINNHIVHKSIDYKEHEFDYDSVYTTRNSIWILNSKTNNYLCSNSFYQVMLNVDQFGGRLLLRSYHQVVRFFYYNISYNNKYVIASSKAYNKMSKDEKSKIVIVVSENNSLIKPSTIYVAPETFRGSSYDSVVNLGKYVKTVKLTESQINEIRKTIPNFPITTFEEYTFSTTINKNNIWGASDINRYPYYNKPSNAYNQFITSQSAFTKILNSSNAILNNNETVTLTAAELITLRTELRKNVIEIQKKQTELNAELNKKHLLFQKIFFLYDNSNFIAPTLLTEFNKEVQLYGEVDVNSYSDNSLIRLIEPKTALKFNLNKSVYKEDLQFQLEDIRQKETSIKDRQIHNLTILIMPLRRRKQYMLVDSIKIIGFANFQSYDKLNPINITIENNKLISYLANKKYYYKFTLDSVLLSSAFNNENDVFHVSCTGLSDVKYSMINQKLLKTLGQINIAEIPNYTTAKDQKRWVNCNLTDSKLQPYASKHSYSFITNNLRNLLDFNVLFLNKKGELLTWNLDEDKVPSVSFTIDILK